MPERTAMTGIALINERWIHGRWIHGNIPAMYEIHGSCKTLHERCFSPCIVARRNCLRKQIVGRHFGQIGGLLFGEIKKCIFLKNGVFLPGIHVSVDISGGNHD